MKKSKKINLDLGLGSPLPLEGAPYKGTINCMKNIL